MFKKLSLALFVSTAILTGGAADNVPRVAQAVRVVSQPGAYNVTLPAYSQYVKYMDIQEARSLDYSAFLKHYRYQRYAVRGHATDNLDFTFFLRGNARYDSTDHIYIAIFNRTGKSDIKITVDPRYVRPLSAVERNGQSFPEVYVLKGRQKVLLAIGIGESSQSLLRITGRMVDESCFVNGAPVAADIMVYTEAPSGFSLRTPGNSQAHSEAKGGWWEKWNDAGKKIGPYFQAK